MDLDALIAVRPHPRQVAWQRRELYAFLHFGMNTMTDVEWGAGHEDPALFDPADLDADQWMRALADGGMTGAILTAKHHDGFCLWPTSTSGHSVASSPWRDGAGDVVREVAEAARRHGLAFGVYLSPWDRTHPSYGEGVAYDDVYVTQLTELLTGYGPLFSVWMDGANGEGPSGRRQQYDWERYVDVIRRLQPDAAISICGPDVRWVGNEAGATRADEWSVVPAELRSAERTAALSQQTDDPAFARRVTSDLDDLGSRAAVAGHEHELAWYPAEVDTSIRPGWFHHPAENASVRPPQELFELWARSVGGNCTLLLNVPPDRAGRIAEPDAAALAGLGERLRSFRSRVLPAAATPSSGVIDGVLDLEHDRGRWSPDAADATPALHVELTGPTRIEAVVLREEITEGQRVERVVVRARRGNDPWTVLAEAGTVGYQRILRFAPVEVDEVVIKLPESRGVPVLAAAVLVGAEPAAVDETSARDQRGRLASRSGSGGNGVVGPV